MKIGQGIDIHNIVESKELQKLAGVEFDLGYKILGHSDGDIILHAISSAISGALSLEDIGTYFSDKDEKNRNLDSLKILNFFIDKMNQENYLISNIDITIICENIIFKNIKHQIISHLKTILNTNNLSLKATRFEKESNQIQCNVLLLLEKNNF